MSLVLYCLMMFSILTNCSSKERTNGVILMTSPAGPNASLPHLVTGEDNNLYLSWVEKQDSGRAQFKYARLEGDSWSQPELIAEGTDWFVNWADYPMIAVDNVGNMLAHYLVKSSSGTYSYDIHVRYKPADGNWAEPVIPHTDGTFTEHGFVTLLPNNDGTFRMAWLDGRNTGGQGHDMSDDHSNEGAMTLRTAVIGPEGVLSGEAELDARVCDCCQTNGTMSEDGLTMVYRDRSENEIRDIYFVQYQNAGWSEPQPVHSDNWKINGCPVNGPRIDSYGSSKAVAWFTGADEQPKVNVAFSNGADFDAPIEVDASSPLGRVDIVMMDEETAIVSWLDRDNEASYIKVRSVSRDGTMTDQQIVTVTDGGRGSGFPQMTATHDAVVFAWTEFVDNNGTSIQVAKTWR